MSTPDTAALACVIEVGHPLGTPAVWQNEEHPEHVVCDRHKQQYETAYDDYSDIKWRQIREGRDDA